MSERWLYIARPSFRDEGRYLHVWFGPLGVHLFWPDVWKSRFDCMRGWR